MKTYKQFKDEQSDKLNNFKGMFFAFSNKQFAEGLAKVNKELSEDFTENDLCSIGGGGFIPKSLKVDLEKLFKDRQEEESRLMKDEAFLLSALVYELSNHEYCYTRDARPALEALSLSIEDIPQHVMKEAIKQTREED